MKKRCKIFLKALKQVECLIEDKIRPYFSEDIVTDSTDEIYCIIEDMFEAAFGVSYEEVHDSAAISYLDKDIITEYLCNPTNVNVNNVVRVIKEAKKWKQ